MLYAGLLAQGKGESSVGMRKRYDAGPDQELADILERDVLDNSPGVRWDQIAGLQDVKRLLEEAVVLPSLMPDYFQVLWVHCWDEEKAWTDSIFIPLMTPYEKCMSMDTHLDNVT